MGDRRSHRLAGGEEQVLLWYQHLEGRVEPLSSELRWVDPLDLVGLGRAPPVPGVEVVRDRFPEAALRSVDGHDHAVREVRRLTEADRLREGDAAQPARA